MQSEPIIAMTYETLLKSAINKGIEFIVERNYFWLKVDDNRYRFDYLCEVSAFLSGFNAKCKKGEK